MQTSYSTPALPRCIFHLLLKTPLFSSLLSSPKLPSTPSLLLIFLTSSIIMADRIHTDTRDRTQTHLHYPGGARDRMTTTTTNGPSASTVIALVTLVPLAGTLLFLAGITLLGSVIGLAVATPIFILFSPIIVPAAVLLGCAVTGFLSSGAFGLTGLSALSRVAGYLRLVGQRVPEELDYAKRRIADMAAYAGQKTKDVGQTVENKARESGTTGRT